MCTCDPSTGKVETGGSLGLSGQWSACEYDTWANLWSLLHVPTCTCTPIHTCMSTHTLPTCSSQLRDHCILPLLIFSQLTGQLFSVLSQRLWLLCRSMNPDTF